MTYKQNEVSEIKRESGRRKSKRGTRDGCGNINTQVKLQVMTSLCVL